MLGIQDSCVFINSSSSILEQSFSTDDIITFLNSRFNTKEGRFAENFKPTLTVDTWNFLCVVFQRHRGVVNFFMNGQVCELSNFQTWDS